MDTVAPPPPSPQCRPALPNPNPNPAPRATLCQLHVHAAPDPALAAWQGAALLGASPEYAHLAVSRQEWKLRGVEALRKWDT